MEKLEILLVIQHSNLFLLCIHSCNECHTRFKVVAICENRMLTMPFELHDSRNHLTLYNAILRIARNFLETGENIKISTHPFYHINLGWFSLEWSKKIFFFRKKKNQNGRLKKSPFSVLFGCFWAFVGQPHGHIRWATSMPFASFNPTNPRTNPLNFHKKISRIGDFEKWPFFQSAILLGNSNYTVFIVYTKEVYVSASLRHRKE